MSSNEATSTTTEDYLAGFGEETGYLDFGRVGPLSATVAAEQEAAVELLVRARSGTLDELFEVLTLVQTGRMKRLPILLFGASFWERVVNWRALAEAGTISAGDLDLVSYVTSPEEAWERIDAWQSSTADQAE